MNASQAGMVRRSGPDPKEQNVIRHLVAEGATIEDLEAKFPDVEPDSLAAWHRSLQPEGAVPPASPPAAPAASEGAENPRNGADGPMPGDELEVNEDELQAEVDREPAVRRGGRGRAR